MSIDQTPFKMKNNQNKELFEIFEKKILFKKQNISFIKNIKKNDKKNYYLDQNRTSFLKNSSITYNELFLIEKCNEFFESRKNIDFDTKLIEDNKLINPLDENITIILKKNLTNDSIEFNVSINDYVNSSNCSNKELKKNQFNVSSTEKLNSSDSSIGENLMIKNYYVKKTTIIELNKNDSNNFSDDSPEIMDSLTNQINSYFMNNENNYDSIEIPNYNFHLSQNLTKELINQLKRTKYEQEYLKFYKSTNDPKYKEIKNSDLNELFVDDYIDLNIPMKEELSFKFFLPNDFSSACEIKIS